MLSSKYAAKGRTHIPVVPCLHSCGLGPLVPVLPLAPVSVLPSYRVMADFVFLSG